MGLAARPGRGRPGHSRRSTGRGRPPDSGWRAGRSRWSRRQRRRRDGGAMAPRGAHGVACAGDFGKAMAAHRHRGARGAVVPPDPDQCRPSAPEHAACRGVLRSRVNRRADSSGHGTRGPDDRPTLGGRSPRRSAVIALDCPVRWATVPGSARLPPLLVTRLPFRVRQHTRRLHTVT